MCTHTQRLHAHFSEHGACTVTSAPLMRVHIHAWLNCLSKRFVAHVSYSPSRFRHLMFHPSLLFLHAYFDITFPSTFFPNFSVLKAQGKRNSARAPRVWLPCQVRSTHTSLTIARVRNFLNGGGIFLSRTNKQRLLVHVL